MQNKIIYLQMIIIIYLENHLLNLEKNLKQINKKEILWLWN